MDNTVIRKRSVRISGHATSITLEDEFWNEFKKIARRRKLSVSALISEIDESQMCVNLSSTLRLYVLKDLQNRLN